MKSLRSASGSLSSSWRASLLTWAFSCSSKRIQKGDLSLVYPIARGQARCSPACWRSPFWRDVDAARYYRDSIDCDQHSFYRGVKRLKESGSFTPVLYGLAVGGIIAAYTLLDKAAVSRFLIPPLLLDYCNTLGRLVILTPYAAKSWSEVRFEWKHHRMEAVGVGVLILWLIFWR